MALPGFIDHAAHRERAKSALLARHGQDFVPVDGWDAFFADATPVRDVKCQMCGEMVAEVRPFGPNHESICEECAAKDMETTLKRHRGLNPNA